MEQDDEIKDPFSDAENPVAVNFDDITLAAYRIKSRIKQTDCVKSEHLTKLTGMNIYLKKECLLPTGTFKERGARNALLALPEEVRKKGIVVGSAGNHALACCYNGLALGIPVTAIMPENASITKVQKCRNYKGNVILYGHELSEAIKYALKYANTHNMTFLNGHDNKHILAGQGTIGLEIWEQVPNLDAVIVPVGGGELIAGVTVAIKALNQDIKVYGAEPERAPALYKALEVGYPISVKLQSTLADSLAVDKVGANAFASVKNILDRVILVEEHFIPLAIVRLIEFEKTVVEGAGATALAAILSGQLQELKSKTICIILSEGNIDSTVLGRVIDRGLAADGRLIKVKVTISDKPGGIEDLCNFIGSLGVSIKDIMHERAWVTSDVFSVHVKVICETRDYDHSLNLRDALASKYGQIVFNSVPFPSNDDVAINAAKERLQSTVKSSTKPRESLPPSESTATTPSSIVTTAKSSVTSRPISVGFTKPDDYQKSSDVVTNQTTSCACAERSLKSKDPTISSKPQSVKPDVVSSIKNETSSRIEEACSLAFCQTDIPIIAGEERSQSTVKSSIKPRDTLPPSESTATTPASIATTVKSSVTSKPISVDFTKSDDYQKQSNVPPNEPTPCACAQGSLKSREPSISSKPQSLKPDAVSSIKNETSSRSEEACSLASCQTDLPINAGEKRYQSTVPSSIKPQESLQPSEFTATTPASIATTVKSSVTSKPISIGFTETDDIQKASGVVTNQPTSCACEEGFLKSKNPSILSKPQSVKPDAVSSIKNEPSSRIEEACSLASCQTDEAINAAEERSQSTVRSSIKPRESLPPSRSTATTPLSIDTTVDKSSVCKTDDFQKASDVVTNEPTSCACAEGSLRSKDPTISSKSQSVKPDAVPSIRNETPSCTEEACSLASCQTDLPATKGAEIISSHLTSQTMSVEIVSQPTLSTTAEQTKSVSTATSMIQDPLMSCLCKGKNE